MAATTATRAAEAELVVGIDIGGTGTRFVAVDACTNEVLARATIPTPVTGTSEDIMSILREQIGRVTRGKRPIAVGVGASGPVDLTGIIRNPDTLPAFTGLPLLDLLTSVTGGPIVIDNDAVCAALAEHLGGAARHSPRSLHITLGTGVGVCLLNDDRPFRHPDGTHPEGGHISVSTLTSPCYCGRPTCWEQAASRRTLQRAAARILNRAATDKTVISELAAHAARADGDALAAFDTYGQAIADGLGTLLTLYGPDIVVVGGSAATYFNLYRETINRSLARLDGWIPNYRLVKTALDDYGGAIGGAKLATTALRESPTDTSPLT